MAQQTVTEQFQVKPRIKDLNRFAHKVRQVAINTIHPIYSIQNNELLAFEISIEGPPKHISYFNRLITDSNLKVG